MLRLAALIAISTAVWSQTADTVLLNGKILTVDSQFSTREAIAMGEGVLYPALHSLETRGLLRARRRAVSGRTRVYYSITAKGRRRHAALREEWRRIADGVELALAGVPNA